MLFLPFENITYKSSLSEEEVLARLHSLVNTETIRNYLWSNASPDTDYQGKIEGSEFHFERIIFYRNSFLPQIVGKVNHDAIGNTIVHVTMRLNFVVMLIIVGAMCSVGNFCFFILTDYYKGAITELEPTPFLILFGLYLITVLGFKFESYKAKHTLERLFEVE